MLAVHWGCLSQRRSEAELHSAMYQTGILRAAQVRVGVRTRPIRHHSAPASLFDPGPGSASVGGSAYAGGSGDWAAAITLDPDPCPDSESSVERIWHVV